MTKINIIDNSGAKVGRCIKILRPKGKKYAEVGDLILVSIQSALATATDIKKGDMFKALVVRTNKPKASKKDQFFFKGSDNAVILVKIAQKTGELTPLASRIKGPVSVILKSNEKTKKVISLAKSVL